MHHTKKNVTALIVRLIMGGIFIYAGYSKLFDPATGASVVADSIKFFASIGLPAFLLYFVAYAEIIAGAFLVVGLWTCLSAALLSIFMIVAVYISFPGGFQSYSYPLITLAGVISLVGSCGGAWAVSRCKTKMCGSCDSTCKVSEPTDAKI